MRRGEDPFTGFPFNTMLPARGGRNPASVMSSVVLPAPLGPRIVSTVRGARVKLRLRATVSLP